MAEIWLKGFGQWAVKSALNKSFGAINKPHAFEKLIKSSYFMNYFSLRSEKCSDTAGDSFISTEPKLLCMSFNFTDSFTAILTRPFIRKQTVGIAFPLQPFFVPIFLYGVIGGPIPAVFRWKVRYRLLVYHSANMNRKTVLKPFEYEATVLIPYVHTYVCYVITCRTEENRMCVFIEAQFRSSPFSTTTSSFKPKQVITQQNDLKPTLWWPDMWVHFIFIKI